jgi:GNAT superfamily N-acetyltransferase
MDAVVQQRAPLVLRRAVAEDLPELLHLGEVMHREIHYGAYAPAKVEAMISDVLLRGVVYVSLLEGSRTIGGTVGLVVEQPWWSEDWQIADRWLFVRPECRREGHARPLLRAAVAFAEAMRLPLLMSHIGPRARGKMRLLQRELGEPVGGIFFVPGAG